MRNKNFLKSKHWVNFRKFEKSGKYIRSIHQSNRLDEVIVKIQKSNNIVDTKLGKWSKSDENRSKSDEKWSNFEFNHK